MEAKLFAANSSGVSKKKVVCKRKALPSVAPSTAAMVGRTRVCSLMGNGYWDVRRAALCEVAASGTKQLESVEVSTSFMSVRIGEAASTAVSA